MSEGEGVGEQRLGTSEARRMLPRLVKQAAARTRPSRALLDNAVEIGSHRKPGAVLIPEVDALSHAKRETELAQRVQELESQIDDMLLGLLVEERLKARRPGEGEPIEQVVRELGLGELLDTP